MPDNDSSGHPRDPVSHNTAGDTHSTAGDAIAINGDRARVVVRPNGELDVSTIAEFSAQVSGSAIDGSDVVVDLRDVTFIDSTCITTLIELARRARASDSSVTVLATQPMMRRIFGILKLNAHLTVDPPLTGADLAGAGRQVPSGS